MRNDLSNAQKAVQVGHACIEVGRSFLPTDGEHPSLIIFGIKSEPKLLSISDHLRSLGIKVREFREPDIGNQLTAIATEPVGGDRRHLFSKYCLLKC